MITCGEFGDVYVVEVVFHNVYGLDKLWFYDVWFSGGGCLFDVGIHFVDFVLWCLDFPRVWQVIGHFL